MATPPPPLIESKKSEDVSQKLKPPEEEKSKGCLLASKFACSRLVRQDINLKKAQQLDFDTPYPRALIQTKRFKMLL